MKYYISYGSNMPTSEMHKRCPKAQLVTTSELKDYQLEFRGFENRVYATVTPHKGSIVPIVMWKVTSEDERILDTYEDYPLLYHKKVIDLKGQAAFIYIMQQAPLGIPAKAYVDIIQSAYEEHHFDQSILQEALTNSIL